MKLSRSAVMKILWPERGSLFAIVGGAIGLSGDITSFFSEFLSPYYLLALFGAISLLSALLCLQRASLAEITQSEKLDDVARCGICDTMRFSLFSFAAFILLLLIGQGQTATETIGEKLGLIHADVQQVQQDVTAVRQDVTAVREELGTVGGNVADIHSVIQSQKPIENPNTPEEFFANAWVYSYAQRDTAKALESLEQMYERYTPMKMDAAELYYASARPVYGRTELIEKMVGQGKKAQDATLLVVAARHAVSEEESEELYKQAKSLNSDVPFAYWDLQRVSTAGGANNLDLEYRKTLLEGQIADIEKFIELIADKPAGYYFYLPQYQPDHEMLARQTKASFQTMLESVNKTIELKKAQKKK